MSIPGTLASPACARCGTELAPGLLACPQCRQLVHAEALKRIAAEAERAEREGDAATATSRWQDALRLLPADTQQAKTIASKIETLGGRMSSSAGSKEPGWTGGLLKGGSLLGVVALILWKFKFLVVLLLTKGKLLLLGLTKMSTLTSMFVFFGVYWSIWGWPFALGFVLAIYIHEMGHVAWLARYGIRASAPMFIPGLGAMVRMKEYPQTPGIDARVGLAGPLWGLGAVVAAWLAYLATGAEIWGAIAKVSAWVNLFNLLPIGPLDGGRGFRALTKQERLFAAAVIGATWFVTAEPLLVLLLIAAVFQVFGKTAEKPDTPVFLWYVAMVALLAAFSTLGVDPRASQA
jgi:Zn-dependent protease